jgi:hypothetical protein
MSETIAATAQPAPQWLTLDEAVAHPPANSLTELIPPRGISLLTC